MCAASDTVFPIPFLFPQPLDKGHVAQANQKMITSPVGAHMIEKARNIARDTNGTK
jgi:hypothetical protein